MSELRVLHLGLGAFARAHLAVYLQAMIDAGESAWSMAATNLRPDDQRTIDALIAAGGAYTLETVSPRLARRYERITALQHVIPFEPELRKACDVAADVATRIVSFTVTEAGYYADHAGRLNLASEDIARDLTRARQGQAGHTIYGAVVALLRARQSAGNASPLTLLCCDNIRHNGARFRSGLLQFIDALDDAELSSWAQANTACPNAMVDRITPRPTDEVRARVAAATGVRDPAAIMAESYIQWVIEDDFPGGRPAWESVGVQMVDSVAPYEEAKIRLLNATHSCIAWAGALKGYRYIHEGTADPAIRAIARAYIVDDAVPALTPSPIDLLAYGDAVLERFGNSAIADTNQRVAADGFAKIPGFVAPTVRERLQAGESIESVAMVPAIFLAFLTLWARGEAPFAYQDQAMDDAAARRICAADDPVAALAADAGLWGEIAADERLVSALRRAVARVDQLFTASA